MLETLLPYLLTFAFGLMFGGMTVYAIEPRLQPTNDPEPPDVAAAKMGDRE